VGGAASSRGRRAGRRSGGSGVAALERRGEGAVGPRSAQRGALGRRSRGPGRSGGGTAARRRSAITAAEAGKQSVKKTAVRRLSRDFILARAPRSVAPS
jgi:hypothetical protein